MDRYRLVITLMILLLSAFILSGCVMPSPQAASTATPPATTAPDQGQSNLPDPRFVRESALAYIRLNHSQYAPAENLIWAQEDITPEGLAGSTTIQYTSGDWVVTVAFPVGAPEAVSYQVEMTNSGTGFSWQGTVSAIGQVSEVAFSPAGSQELRTYTNEEYQFTFSYPSSWALDESPGGEQIAGGISARAIHLTQDGYLLVIQYKNQAETTTLGPGSRPAGEVEDGGTVSFFEQQIPRQVLVFEGQDKQVFYDHREDDLEFYIQLDDMSAADYASIALPVELQAEVDQILETFAHTGEPTPPPEMLTPTPTPGLADYINPEYQFSLQYPDNWELVERPHLVALRQDTRELIIEFRWLYESISIGPTGTPAGEMINKGNVTILGKSYPRSVLTLDEAEKVVYYNGTSTIPAGDLDFAISLQEMSTDIQASLPDLVQAEADQIVESLEVTIQNEESCTDLAEFVEDVSVPDGSTFAPGEAFVKTWRLRNEGTCIWTTDYELVSVSGDAMGASEPVQLTQLVSPDSESDLSVELVAPDSAGNYLGEWMLRNPQGATFGVGEGADKPFWVEIEVEQVLSESQLGSPDWTDTFTDSSNWYLLNTQNTHYSMEDGRMVLHADQPGQGEEWGLSTHPPLTDFYMEASFTTGSQCSGRDRYGMLVRAPDQNSGYVYGFTCDGRFRLYKWDGENYQGLQEWTASPHILTGPDQTNRMGFWAEGDSLKLYANGWLLAEISDSTYDQGRFGIYIGSTATEDLEVYVEEISYWELGQ